MEDRMAKEAQIEELEFALQVTEMNQEKNSSFAWEVKHDIRMYREQIEKLREELEEERYG